MGIGVHRGEKVKASFLLRLLLILVIALGLLSGCRSTATANAAKELSLASQEGFVAGEQLACTFTQDEVESYKAMGLKEAAAELESGYHVRLQPLRMSGAAYDELEHVVEIYRTEKLAKKAFDEWNEPIWGLRYVGGMFVFGLEPIRHGYEAIEVPSIGDETKAWRTKSCEIVIVFRKGRVMEAVAVSFSSQSQWEDLLFGERALRLYRYAGQEAYLSEKQGKTLVEWSVWVAEIAAGHID